MIDPIHSLAFSIQASPGVYAVLVGSGVSRAAGIPTGWEVTLDLIRKLAKLHDKTFGPNPDDHPERWYLEKFKKRKADYSDLLDELARTSTGRQQLLRKYYEPNDLEREEDKKKPTVAHRAIAALAAQGFIKVIITTNFDHLVETALRDEEVEPTILSSPDQVQGAPPLIHTQCCVFKVHGDYLDTRIRNTPAELDQYPLEFNLRLDRIFDEFGLIVCGWSAEWDGALRKAISRVPSPRFTTYWAVLRGDEPGDEAKRLIDHRGAQVIPIKDADAFFQTIQEHVESIQEYVESIEKFSRPHPLPTKAVVKDLKHYLSSPEHRIRLADLINTTVEQVLRATSGEAFEVQGTQQPNVARFRAYESPCSTLLAMASIGGFWAEDSHYDGWKQAMERLSTSSSRVPTSSLAMRTYPGRLLLYTLGLGAVKSDKSDKLQFLNHIFKTTAHYYHYGGIGKWQHKEDYVLTALFNAEIMTWLPGGRLLEGIKKWYEPSNWLHDALRQPLKQLIPDNENFSFIFDKLEILIALGFGYRNKHQEYWVPLGAFYHREENEKCILAEITESISQKQDISPFVQCGIFGETPEECLQSLEHFKSFVLRCSKDPLRRTP